MTDYDTLINVGQKMSLAKDEVCIPTVDFITFCQSVVFKTDAIKLGLLCFILGIGFWMFITWLDKKWVKK